MSAALAGFPHQPSPSHPHLDFKLCFLPRLSTPTDTARPHARLQLELHFHPRQPATTSRLNHERAAHTKRQHVRLPVRHRCPAHCRPDHNWRNDESRHLRRPTASPAPNARSSGHRLEQALARTTRWAVCSLHCDCAEAACRAGEACVAAAEEGFEEGHCCAETQRERCEERSRCGWRAGA